MSKVMEMARAEADAAEAEDDTPSETETEPDRETEGEPEPAEPEPVEPESAIDQKALESELARHERAMQKVLGDAFPDMVACATCDGFGYTPQRVEPMPDPVQDPQTRRCDQCLGLGLTRTGSLRDGQVLQSCSRCQGNGWTGMVATPAQTQTLDLPTQPTVATPSYGEPPQMPPGWIAVPTGAPPPEAFTQNDRAA